MKQKLSVAEFAALSGTTSKTIYERIKRNSELPLNEQLETVNEKIKGREVTLIITDSEQIEIYKNIYGKNTVNESEYYEVLTDNNGLKQLKNDNKTANLENYASYSPNIIDKLLTLNNEYNNRIDTVRNELMLVHKQLMESEKKTLLLEDKASREGYYINENRLLQNEIKSQSRLIKWLITVIVTLIIVISISLTWLITVIKLNSESTEKPLQQEVTTVENSL